MLKCDLCEKRKAIFALFYPDGDTCCWICLDIILKNMKRKEEKLTIFKV